MMRRPLACPWSATTNAGTPAPSASRFPFGDVPHRISGSDGHSIECRSNSTSTVSISGRISRARSSSVERRALSSTAASHTRLMSSSTKRDAVGWRGSNRSYAARLTKPNVSLPRVGASRVSSSRSSTIAPAISLPCAIASSATCGPATPESRVMKPRTPVLPGSQRPMSGAVRCTSNDGNAGCEIGDMRCARQISTRSTKRRMNASHASS